MKKTVLEKPLVTEKSMLTGEYAFKVDRRATKPEIAAQIKKTFAVDPVSVRTMIIKGKKRKSWRTRKIVKLGDWKKAIVRIKKDQKIDIFEAGKEESKK